MSSKEPTLPTQKPLDLADRPAKIFNRPKMSTGKLAPYLEPEHWPVDHSNRAYPTVLTFPQGKVPGHISSTLARINWHLFINIWLHE